MAAAAAVVVVVVVAAAAAAAAASTAAHCERLSAKFQAVKSSRKIWFVNADSFTSAHVGNLKEERSSLADDENADEHGMDYDFFLWNNGLLGSLF